METLSEDRVKVVLDQIASGVALEQTLNAISTNVAAELGAPTCKIWVVKRGDICERCSLAAVCSNREICLHLAAVTGSQIEREHSRIPLSVLNASLILKGGASKFDDNSIVGEKLFGLQRVEPQPSDSFAIVPLRGPSGILGLMGVFNRRSTDPSDVRTLYRFAPSAVAAIRIAELQARCEGLKQQNQKQAQWAESVQRVNAVRERELTDSGSKYTRQLSEMDSEIRRVQAERDAIALESAESIRRLELLEDENRSLRERAQELIALHQESARAFSQWAAELESDRNRLEEAHSTLLERNKTLEDHISKTGHGRDNLATEIVERNLVLEGLRAELDLKHAELISAREQVLLMQSRMAALDETNLSLRGHNAALTESIDDLGRSNRIAEDARARSEQLRAALASKITELTVEMEALRTDKSKIHGESEQLLREIELIKHELPSLRSTCDQLGDENTSLKTQNVSLAEARERAESRVSELEAENARIDANINRLEGMIQRHELTVAGMEESTMKLRYRLESAERARTELDQRNRLLVEQNRRLQIESQVKARFLANMSHELRTPMNAIIGFTSLLSEDAALQLSDRHRRNLERISRNARELLQLINNVLDLSRLDSGRVEIYVEPVDVRSVIERSVIALDSVKQGHTINIDIEEGMQPIETDRTRLQQIITNLLSNAIKFTYQGEIKVSAMSAGPNLVRISIADNGIGIAETDIPRIFDEFRQVSRSASGSGLGLTITRRLLDLICGQIHVTSKLGKGSTFTIELPVRSEGKTLAPEVQEQSIPGMRKLLVVDPNPASLYVAKRFLIEAGYHVSATDDPVRAIQLARTERPAVIAVSTEIQNESPASIEALARECAASGLGTIIAIAAGEDAERSAFHSGATLAVRRPLDRRELLRVVERALNPQRSTVLVVDDDQDTVDLITEMLESASFEVVPAASAEQALGRLDRVKPDAVIMDLTLPEMDGLELVERITANSKWTDLPILLMTGRDLSFEERRALDQSTIRIIAKGGFNRDQIVTEIHEALAESQARKLQRENETKSAGSRLLQFPLSEGA